MNLDKNYIEALLKEYYNQMKIFSNLDIDNEKIKTISNEYRKLRSLHLKIKELGIILEK